MNELAPRFRAEIIKEGNRIRDEMHVAEYEMEKFKHYQDTDNSEIYAAVGYCYRSRMCRLLKLSRTKWKS